MEDLSTGAIILMSGICILSMFVALTMIIEGVKVHREQAKEERRRLFKSAERYMKSDEYKKRSSFGSGGLGHIDAGMMLWSECLEESENEPADPLNQTPFEQTVRQAHNGSL